MDLLFFESALVTSWFEADGMGKSKWEDSARHHFASAGMIQLYVKECSVEHVARRGAAGQTRIWKVAVLSKIRAYRQLELMTHLFWAKCILWTRTGLIEDLSISHRIQLKSANFEDRFLFWRLSWCSTFFPSTCVRSCSPFCRYHSLPKFHKL